MTARKRSTREEMATRIDAIFALLVKGVSNRDIIAYAIKTWALSAPHTYHLIEEARECIKKSHVYDRDYELARELLRRDALYQKATMSEGVRSALAVADSRCELLGLFEPIVIEHRAENPYGHLTKEETRFALDTLDALQSPAQLPAERKGSRAKKPASRQKKASR